MSAAGLLLKVMRDETHAVEKALSFMSIHYQSWPVFWQLLRYSSEAGPLFERFVLDEDFLSALKNYPQKMSTVWGIIRAEVSRGNTEGLEGLKEELEAITDGQIRNLYRASDLLTSLRPFVRSELSIIFREASSRLIDFKEKALRRWKTLEDLEDLLASEFDLPASKLAELEQKYPAPEQWYSEDSKPF